MNKIIKLFIILSICVGTVGCTKVMDVAQKVNEAEPAEVQMKNETEKAKQKSKRSFLDFIEEDTNNEEAETEELQSNNNQQTENKIEEVQEDKSKDNNVAEFKKSKEVREASTVNETPNQEEEINTNPQRNYDEPINYIFYSNGKYGFSIEYPDFFCIGRESDCGDGITLATTSGDAEFSASGILNEPYKTVDTLYEKEISQHPNAAYKVKEEDFFVVSWLEGNMIVYQNTVVGEELLNTFIIKYPVAQKEMYDPIVTRMYNSFHTTGKMGY